MSIYRAASTALVHSKANLYVLRGWYIAAAADVVCRRVFRTFFFVLVVSQKMLCFFPRWRCQKLEKWNLSLRFVRRIPSSRGTWDLARNKIAKLCRNTYPALEQERQNKTEFPQILQYLFFVLPRWWLSCERENWWVYVIHRRPTKSSINTVHPRPYQQITPWSRCLMFDQLILSSFSFTWSYVLSFELVQFIS